MKLIQRLPKKLLAGLVAGAALTLSAQADIAAMIDDCDACHGKDGVSEFTDMPTIAGISALAHADALYVYRDAARPCHASKYRYGDTSRAEKTMCDIVNEMTDEQIEAIASHYAARKFVPAKQDFDAGRAARGKAVHDEHCDKCHTDGGANPDDDASILAGQQMGYLRQSFADYRSGERDQTKKMKVKLDKLNDDDVEALVHYYAAAHP